MRFKLYGASDDLVEAEGDISGEIGCYDSVVDVMIGEPGSSCIVTLTYAPPGAGAVWQVAVRQEDEDIPIPGAFTIGAEGNSAVLHAEVPDGTPVMWRRVTARGEHGAWLIPE